MQYPQQQKHRRAIAVARTGSGDRQSIDIVTLSLIGLTFAVVEITQYVGTDVLRQMFAP